MSSLEWKLCWAIRLLFYDKQVDETVWFFQWENGGCELSELEMKIKTIPVCAVWNSTHQFNPAGKHNGLLGVWNCLKQYPLPLVLVVSFLFQHTDTFYQAQSYSLLNSCLQSSHCGCHHELTHSKASLVIKGKSLVVQLSSWQGMVCNNK